MIEVQNVFKRYGRRLALSGVSLTLQSGEVTLLLGPNGAGKSTLLRCILGITDFEGRIRVAGIDPLRDGRAVRARIGYMPQSGGLHHDLTVAETIRFHAAVRRCSFDHGMQLLEEAGLADHAAEKVGDLSGGMRQRLGFTLALLSDPEILVLDEPSASLDAASREWLADRLRAAAAAGRAVLLSTHAGQELTAAGDRCVVLEEGRVVSHRPTRAGIRHGQTWMDTDQVGRGRTRTGTDQISHGQTRMDTDQVGRGRTRTGTDQIGHGQTRMDTDQVGHGRTRTGLDQIGHGQTRMDTDQVGRGRTRTDTVQIGCGRTRTDRDQIGRTRKETNLGAGSVAPVIWKELKDAVRNRWLTGYALVLGVLGLAAAATGIESSVGLALQAFGRTTATLTNLCLLLAPLVAVTMGAASIAGERDRGTLEHLLAQPLTRTGLLLGKHAGLVIALTAATLLGFLPAGVLVAMTAGPGVLGHYLVFPAIASGLSAAMAAVGVVVSVSSRTAVQSQGVAMFVWFVFVLLYDLLLMGTLALSGMRVELLAACLVANPVDAARVVAVLALEPDLYLLGPAGAYLAAQFSRGGAALMLVGALVFWAVAPLLLAVFRFRLPRTRQVPHAMRQCRSMEEVTSS